MQLDAVDLRILECLQTELKLSDWRAGKLPSLPAARVPAIITRFTRSSGRTPR